MNKANIIVSEDCFDNAYDAEMCMDWAEDFLNSDRTIESEIDDIEDTIQNEKIFHLGFFNEWEAEMHENNIENYCAYLVWLKSLNN